MKRNFFIFFLWMAASMMAFAQKNHETDTVRAPLAYVYNIDHLLITLNVDSSKYKVQLGGKPKDEIPALGELDLRPGDTLTLYGVRNPRKKLRKEDPHMLSAKILSVDYANNHDKQPCYIFSMEQKPTFLGRDMNSFSTWVNSQLVYPERSKFLKSEGVVHLRFTIDQNGELMDLEVLKDSGDPDLNAEALRVVSSSPRWQPGWCKGKPVKTKLVFPVIFSLRQANNKF